MSSFAIPIPVSVNVITAQLSFCSSEISMLPPLTVYLIALSIRLKMSCPILNMPPITTTFSIFTIFISTPLDLASGIVWLNRSSTISSSLILSIGSFTLLSIRARSRRLFTIAFILSTSSRLLLIISRKPSRVFSVLSAISISPFKTVRGVFSS